MSIFGKKKHSKNYHDMVKARKSKDVFDYYDDFFEGDGIEDDAYYEDDPPYEEEAPEGTDPDEAYEDESDGEAFETEEEYYGEDEEPEDGEEIESGEEFRSGDAGDYDVESEEDDDFDYDSGEEDDSDEEYYTDESDDPDEEDDPDEDYASDYGYDPDGEDDYDTGLPPAPMKRIKKKNVTARKNGVSSGRRKNKPDLIGSLAAYFRHMSGIDWAVAFMGICILIIALVAGMIYVDSRATARQVASFAEIGSEFDSISIIGESGLLAVGAMQQEKMMTDIEEPEEEIPEEPSEEEEEEESEAAVTVILKVSSIQSDIKIKFVNKSSEKLIGGVPFKVHVKGDNGKEFDLEDDDKDGIIYTTKIANGTYKISVEALSGSMAERYDLPKEAASVSVTDTIAYKKVDVKEEIKTEAQVNAAAEDTAVQDTVVESVLQDTVEWVESTKTPIESEAAYEEVNDSDIEKPAMAKATVRSTYEMLYMGVANVLIASESSETPAGEEKPGEESPKTDEKPAFSSGLFDAEIEVDATVQLSASMSDGSAISWSSDNDCASVDSSGLVTGKSAGTATITAKSDSTGDSASCTITVKEKKEEGTDNSEPGKEDEPPKENEKKSISLDVSEVSLTVGAEVTVNVTTENTDETVVWSSSDEEIASVKDGKIKGLKEGTATVTAALESDSSISASCPVTVTAGEVDETAPLNDTKGNQLYVRKKDGTYRKATVEDYLKDKYTFYRKTSGETAYRYTGWQTIDGYTYFYDKEGNYVTGEQVIQGAKYTFGSDGRLSAGSGILGIDVSKWNGDINWNEVKKSGISFVIIRCGYRGSSTGAMIEDPKFRSNIKGAKAAGLNVGVYFFTQAVNEVEAVEEASMALSLIGGYGVDLPVYLDVEGSGGRGDRIDAGTRTAVCKAFCATVQNSGYKAGIYANKTWLTSYINVSALTGYKIWLAQYAAAPTYSATRYDMWQYTSKGTIAGISGRVDMNIRYN